MTENGEVALITKPRFVSRESYIADVDDRYVAT